MNIIFFTIFPFNREYALKYGFDVLEKKGFNVIVLNVFHIYYPEIVNKLPQHYSLLKPVAGVDQISIRSENDLREYLNNLHGRKIAMLVMSFNIRLLRILKYANVNYIILRFRSHPIPKQKTFLNRLKRFLKDKPTNVFYKIINKNEVYFACKFPLLFGINYPSYFVTTQIKHRLDLPKNSKTKTIYIHSLDFDRYLRNKNKPRPVNIQNEKYFIFIANNPWGDRDHVFSGYNTKISRSYYMNIINQFFDFIEELTGIHVVIAAHPTYTEEDNVYNGRSFLRDTEQLIKYSSGVFLHYSSAVSFAVIHKKPVCFISTDKMKQDMHIHGFISVFAEELKSKIYYIDRKEDLRCMKDNGIFSYNQNAYSYYSRKYIKPFNTSDRLLWNIMADTFLKESI